MAQAKGEQAIEILRRPEIVRAFTDADNPVPKQVIHRLADWFLNGQDKHKIEKAEEMDGPTGAASALLECLIKHFTDEPDRFTLGDFIEVLENLRTNVKLAKLLRQTQFQCLNSDMVRDIKARLQYMCENVQQVWGKLLDEVSLQKCFVEPEIIEEEIGEDGERRKKKTGKLVENFKQLFQFQSFGDRIIIEGDPGMGKTTYVNKLALDWTWDEGTENYSENTQFLQDKFSALFLIPLRSLNGGKLTTFEQAACVQLPGCGSWISGMFQSDPSKCLLILDAFDEYDERCPEINEIIEGKRFPRLKVIITTRPSHIHRLLNKNQWLSITGLTTPEKRERFLIKQGWDKLEERDMIVNALSGLGNLWHTPLYLAMWCVLYKAKKVTGFDPLQPNCFYVLVKLFTDHILSRKSKEKRQTNKRYQLKKEDRLQLKLYIQKLSIEQFAESNPWISEALGTETAASESEDLLKLSAGQFGLITIREETSPITGEEEEMVSFSHQMFLEYYAAAEFAPLFNNHSDKTDLAKLIQENVDISASPFSYFLAAECPAYSETLVKLQKVKCEENKVYVIVGIKQFPWLPVVKISEDIFKNVPEKLFQHLKFFCDLRSVKNFWGIDIIKELCIIAQPRMLGISEALLSYHDQSLDYILSSVDHLELNDCNFEHVNLAVEKLYPNVTKFHYHMGLTSQVVGLEVLRHFSNLRTLKVKVDFTNKQVMVSLCDKLKSLNHLTKLQFYESYKKAEKLDHLNQLADSIKSSSLRQTLKKLSLSHNVLDIEPDPETSGCLLLKAISNYVQLELLDLSECFRSPHSVRHIICLAKTIESSSLCQTLKEFRFYGQNRMSNGRWSMVKTK